MPSLFGDVGVLRDQRVNVGHWNLPERSVEDVRLFRFSGYEPDAPERATRYADRLATGSLNGAGEHFERYRTELLDAGWEEARAWPYAFDRFANGEPVPAIARALHDELGGERFGDPFAVGPGSFAAWLREPADARWPAREPPVARAARAPRRPARGVPGAARRRPARVRARGRAAAARRSTASRRRSTPRASRARHARGGHDRRPQPPAGGARARGVAARARARGGAARRRRRRGRTSPAATSRSSRTASASSTSPELGLGADPLELCVRLKPAALAALLDEGHSAVLFLDPDQWVLGDLEPLWAAIERSAIVLTPHLTAPVAAGRERMLLRAGTHNAGALGVSDRPAARAMLAWWAERLDAANHDRVDEGAYYDQRWLDLVPSLFDGVEVLRDERFNVGHWNLPERDAADVRLLHASGFDPERPRTVTGHDPRLDELEATRVAALLERYAEALLAAGAREAAALPWGWSRFADGTPVPRGAGELLAALGSDGAAFRADPLAAGPGQLRRVAGEPRRRPGAADHAAVDRRPRPPRGPARGVPRPAGRRPRGVRALDRRSRRARARRRAAGPETPVHAAPAVR